VDHHRQSAKPLPATDVVANQSEAKYTFDTGNWHHTAVGGVEVSREISSIDTYTGLRSELVTAGSPFTGSGSLSGVNALNPQYTNIPFTTTPALTGKPTKIAIDTTSGYLLDSANYRDLVILNGGIRFDDYNIKASGFGTSGSVAGVFGSQAAEFGMPNFNLGLTLNRCRLPASMSPTPLSSDPVGSEFDGTSAAYGGLAPILNGGSTQILARRRTRRSKSAINGSCFNDICS